MPSIDDYTRHAAPAAYQGSGLVADLAPDCGQLMSVVDVNAWRRKAAEEWAIFVALETARQGVLASATPRQRLIAELYPAQHRAAVVASIVLRDDADREAFGAVPSEDEPDQREAMAAFLSDLADQVRDHAATEPTFGEQLPAREDLLANVFGRHAQRRRARR